MLSQVLELQPAIKRSKKPHKTNAEYLQENSSNWYQVEKDGYHLPGTKPKRDTCGDWAWKGCNNIQGHKDKTFNGCTMTGKGYATNFQMCCFRADCEYCWLNWSYRQASKATKRIEKFESMTNYKVRHIIISVPQWDYGKDPKVLRKMARDKLNAVMPNEDWNKFGGCIVYHPNRKIWVDSDQRFRWYYSPHFHVMGFGWTLPTKETNEIRQGWIIETQSNYDDYNKRERSTFQTLSYILTHAGIKKGKQTLTWFGDLSYCKLSMPKEDYLMGNCPICECKLSNCRPNSEFYFKPPDYKTEFVIDLDKWEFDYIEKSYQQPGVKLPYTNGKKAKKIAKKEAIKKPYRVLSLKYWINSQKPKSSVC